MKESRVWFMQIHENGRTDALPTFYETDQSLQRFSAQVHKMSIIPETNAGEAKPLPLHFTFSA